MILGGVEDHRWQDDAACRGMDPALFFLNRGEVMSDEVRETCAGCPVRDDCLEESLLHRSFGVWGGLTERGRRAVRRERNLAWQRPA